MPSKKIKTDPATTLKATSPSQSLKSGKCILCIKMLRLQVIWVTQTFKISGVEIKGDPGPQTPKKLAGSLAVIRVRPLWVPSSPALKSLNLPYTAVPAMYGPLI